jgi:hypothetical protein
MKITIKNKNSKDLKDLKGSEMLKREDEAMRGIRDHQDPRDLERANKEVKGTREKKIRI